MVLLLATILFGVPHFGTGYAFSAEEEELGFVYSFDGEQAGDLALGDKFFVSEVVVEQNIDKEEKSEEAVEEDEEEDVAVSGAESEETSEGEDVSAEVSEEAVDEDEEEVAVSGAESEETSEGEDDADFVEIMPYDSDAEESDDSLGEEDTVYVPEDSEIVLDVTIQGYHEEDYVYAYNDKGEVYISLSQLASFVGIGYERQNNVITAVFMNDKERKFFIDLNNVRAKDGQEYVAFDTNEFRYVDNTLFFSTSFLQRLFKIDISYDFYAMTMDIDREDEFPTMVKRNAQNRRENAKRAKFADKSYKDYEFDERLIAAPVFDLTLGKGWRHAPQGRTYNNGNYAVNISAIAAGLDVNAYASGDSYDNYEPQIRLYGGRTLLGDEPNKLNLRQFWIGDINGINNSYFVSESYGRGATFSSFKNLVMSADKTIDITGPLRDGWEVELYWNEQLVGYRQNAVMGQYDFPNIPVSYGLNVFKLVFYGPNGETYTEEKRYTSGTSPVAKGETGYHIALYQPQRYLFENNETMQDDKTDTPILDSTFYYGLSNDLTLMGGLTQTPDAFDEKESQQFGMAGVQYSVSGSSVQYNLEQNLNTFKSGHHFEFQGDVHYGSIYAMYDQYNGLHSPQSSSGDEYLKNKTEFRYNNNLYNIPYYVGYSVGRKESNDKPYERINARASKNISSRWYISAEDSYDAVLHENNLRPSVYTYWDKYTLNTNLNYQTNPNPELEEFSTKLSWRQDRNTYYTFGYRRDVPEKMDYYSVSGSRIFDFGSLSLSLSLDKKGDFSSYLTYNISLAKEPDKFNILTSAESKLNSTGSIYAVLHDDKGNPLEGVGITAANMEKELFTDENGAVFVTNLPANGKTEFGIDMETLDDISLKPEKENIKLVLRPGTIKELDIEFKHYSTIEGQLENPENKRMYGYKVEAVDSNNEVLVSSFSDLDGYFILTDVPYGTVDIVVSKDNVELARISDVIVDDAEVVIEQEISTNAESGFDDNDNHTEENTENVVE